MTALSQLTLAFLLPVLAKAPDPSSGKRDYSALRFDSGGAVADSLALLDALNGDAVAPHRLSRKEMIAYDLDVKLSLFKLTKGDMRLSIEPARLGGRDCLHMVQRGRVLGRYQNEESYTDVHGGLPYRYALESRRTKRDTAFFHLVLWDRLGGNVYLQKQRPNGILRQYVWKLGRDEPWDSTDPLSAVALYRQQCEAALHVVPWARDILLGCDERYRLSATPQPKRDSTTAGLRGVDWHWEARKCDQDDKTVRGQLAIHSNAVPVHYEAKAWGMKGSAELTTYRLDPTARDP